MSVSTFVCRRTEKQESRSRGRPVVRIQERTNVGYVVRFLLDGQEFERRVIRRVDDPAQDVNAESPVGRALLIADVGDEIEVEAPGGCVVVKVLDIR